MFRAAQAPAERVSLWPFGEWRRPAGVDTFAPAVYSGDSCRRTASSNCTADRSRARVTRMGLRTNLLLHIFSSANE